MNLMATFHGFQCPAAREKESNLSGEERRAIYQAAGIQRDAWNELEGIIKEAPARETGKGALNNMVGALYSHKNGALRTFESHTVERPYLYMLELDPTVLAYYTQPRIPNVESTNRNGGLHVGAITADVIVLRSSSIAVVECKSLGWLKKEATKTDTKWKCENGFWSSPAISRWCDKRAVQFSVFAQEDVCGIELQNLEYMYAISNQASTARDEMVMRRAMDVLEHGPATIIELAAFVAGFSTRHAAQMLARKLAYGLTKTRSINMEDEFILFSDEFHARSADSLIFSEIGASLAPINVSRPILTATPSDVAIARSRLGKISAMATRRGPVSERTVRLQRTLAIGVSEGLSELEALLGKTHRSGNRLLRLSQDQYTAMADVVLSEWESGNARTIELLHIKLENLCAARGLRAPCKSTLRIALRKSSASRRALNMGGMRAFQAIRLQTPGDKRSLPPVAYGHTLHIDSSQLDTRCAPSLLSTFPAENPTFYIGVDGAAGKPMAHSLIFGPARSDGLALLIRDYVARNGFLPCLIVLDRGTENRSKWFRGFCKDMCISWMHTPTGGSRFNGLAENVIGRVNSQHSHELRGSTHPDQRGRAVDGKFKSRRTAFLQFEKVASLFKAFVYSDLCNTPNDDNLTPNQIAEELQSFGEHAGTKALLDASMLVATSVSVKSARRIDRGAIRTSLGRFTSTEFQAAVRTNKYVDEIRSDCVNPSVLYARLATTWYQVFNRLALVYQQVSDSKKLWRLLIKPLDAAAARATRHEIARERHDRTQSANQTAAENSHLSPEALVPEKTFRANDKPEPNSNLTWVEANDFV